MRKILSLVVALAMIISLLPMAVAEEAAVNDVLDNAYLMFADSSWAYSYWGENIDANVDGKVTLENGVVATVAGITADDGAVLTVGLDFTATEAKAISGVAFAAIGIVNGEATLPNHYIKVADIRVNGESIAFTKGYTSSDDGVCTRMNLYNEWVSELPVDARSYDGSLEGAAPIMLDQAALANAQTIEIDFSVLKYAEDVAYIAYASSDWSVSNWGMESSEAVTVAPAAISGPGAYTTSLTFASAAEGAAFTALYVQNGEITYPGCYLKINDIRINGESITVAKGYTSSDDQITTRMNIYNEWVSELPVDAHSWDGTVEDASPVIVDTAAFAGVTSYEIDFELVPVTAKAYIAYASSDWAVSNWDANGSEAVVVETATVDGPGSYTTSLTFNTPAAGTAFTALYMDNGENAFPGYFLNITEIKVNGETVPMTAKGFTTSDDGIVTRENIFNEWVNEIPSAARVADGDLEGVSAVIVDTAAFAEVNSMEVSFDVIYGEAPVVEEEALTAEAAAELLKAEYNAYFGCQGTTTYVFRNAWNDSYGKNDEAHPYFYQLTGWADTASWAAEKGIAVESAEDNSVNMGGTFVDAVINGAGTYTVSCTTGDLGFGATTAFNLLYVSTDIPSALVTDGYLIVSDVTCKIGSGKTLTMEHELVDATGDYVQLRLLDTYNYSSEPFGYTVPGANETITITFTLSVAE